MTRLVYFIKPKGKKGPIKIGSSNTPSDRLLALGAWSPWPLEMIGTVPGSMKDEMFLHGCLAAHHSHREWFRASPEVLWAVMRVLEAGSIEAIRGEINPTGAIIKNVRRKRTEDERRRFSYASRVRHCQDRVRKQQPDRYRAPEEVSEILQRWGGYWSVDPVSKLQVRHRPAPSTPEELAIIDRYLADPLALSVAEKIWRPNRDPICIPVFGQDMGMA